jgi:2-polyprenyl-3-methyl-5-hydroxy-6-metoxy-1,4-benzoquinol methylase
MITQDNVDYNNWHASHSIDDDTNTPWHSFIKEKLNKIGLDKKIVLEIGCGRGGFSNYLATVFPHVTKIFASDYSSEALRIANEKYSDHNQLITWRQEDIMALTYKDQAFDVIISCETIEHVPHPAKAIRELYRVLKPGGILLLTCPNYFNPFGIWCFYRWLIGKPFTEGGQPYVNYLQMPVIYYSLKATGYKIVEWHTSEIIIPARVPKHLWNKRTPVALQPFGYRTYYQLKKPTSDK